LRFQTDIKKEKPLDVPSMSRALALSGA
jgi:hypothetical protein